MNSFRTSSLFCLLVCCAFTSQAQTSPATPVEKKLVLHPAMLLSETALGDTAKLVDEQVESGDPAAQSGKQCKSAFFAGWTAWQYPLSIVLDLGRRHHVTRLFFYNESGENPIRIGTGNPSGWKETDAIIGGYQNWREIAVNADTRFVRVTLLKPASLGEMVAYGYPVEAATKPVMAKRKPHRTPTMDNFIGTNGFIDDPIETLSTPVGFLREYHSWGWDTESSDGKTRFQPSGAAGGQCVVL